jgi:hypothetical protein
MDFKHKNYLKTTDDAITKGKHIINNNSNENPWVVTFSPEDTMEDKLRKAAHVKPSEA